jgi:hypothetical protein
MFLMMEQESDSLRALHAADFIANALFHTKRAQPNWIASFVAGPCLERAGF